MKKNRNMSYAVLGIAFILFNVIAFVIPTEKTSTFWTAYIFSVIAFAAQIGIWHFAFKGAETIKSKFLGIPLIHIGIVYLVIQLVAFTIFMTVPTIPSWIAVIVCVLIFGISAICLISGEAAKDEINRVEKISRKVFFIKELQIDMEMLAEQETDSDVKVALLKLAEKIRFSDPMSNDALAECEAKISRKIAELKVAENKSEIITELDLLLTERSKKAKLLK